MPLVVLTLLALLLSAADHWTTFLCLREPVLGWHVSEANPLSDWLFRTVGLAEGLLLDSVVTLAALLFLHRTRQVPHGVKLAFLVAVVLGTAFAVANNLDAAGRMGLSVVPGVRG